MRKTLGFTVQSGTFGCRDRQCSGALLGAGTDSAVGHFLVQEQTVRVDRRLQCSQAAGVQLELQECLNVYKCIYGLYCITLPTHPIPGTVQWLHLLPFIRTNIRYNNNYSCTVVRVHIVAGFHVHVIEKNKRTAAPKNCNVKYVNQNVALCNKMQQK